MSLARKMQPQADKRETQGLWSMFRAPAYYHIYIDGLRVTHAPVTVNDIRAKFGITVQELERSGHRLIQVVDGKEVL